MNDSISRHAALVECYELKEARRHWDTETGRAEIRGIDAAMCVLNSLPSEQTERNKGEWIPIMRSDILDGYLCSVCGRRSGFKYKFCGNCGADMRRDNT